MRRRGDFNLRKVCVIRRKITAALVAWVVLVCVVGFGFLKIENTTNAVCHGQNGVREEVRRIIIIATTPDPSQPLDPVRQIRANEFRRVALNELAPIDC